MSQPQQDKIYDQMKQHVLSYCKPNDTRAWLNVAATLAIEAIAILLINLNLSILGWSIHCLNQVRIFIQFHDMAHFSFWSSFTLNRWIGKIYGIWLHYPFDTWRDGHNHHHKHFGNLDRLDLSQTILFTKKQYESWPTSKKIIVRIFREPVVFFLFTLPLVWSVLLFLTIGKRYKVWSFSFLEKCLAVVVTFWVLPIFGVPAFKFFVIHTLAWVLGTVLFHLQHSVNLPYRQRKDKWNSTKAALEGSTFIEVPLLLKPFTNGIEYHHIHHLNTNVGSYAIQECHDTYQAKKCKEGGWDALGMVTVDLSLAIKSLSNVMLDEETGLIVPFSYSHL